MEVLGWLGSAFGLEKKDTNKKLLSVRASKLVGLSAELCNSSKSNTTS